MSSEASSEVVVSEACKMRVEPKLLRRVVRALQPFTSEVRLEVGAGIIEIRAVDPANVAMVVLKIPKTAVNYEGTENAKFAMEIDRLLSIAKSSEDVEIEINREKTTIKQGRVTFTSLTLDPSSVRRAPRVPELEMTATVEVEGQALKKAVDFAEKIEDNVKFTVEDGAFVIEAKGDVESVKVDLTKDSTVTGEEACAYYSGEYLKEALKYIDNDDTLEVKFATNYPVLITTRKDGVEITHIVAPRIISDD